MNIELNKVKILANCLNDKFGKRKIQIKGKNNIKPKQEIKKIKSSKIFKEEIGIGQNDSKNTDSSISGILSTSQKM